LVSMRRVLGAGCPASSLRAMVFLLLRVGRIP
jgi:hypothetical protein